MDLLAELRETLTALDIQIIAVRQRAEQMKIKPHNMRDTNGGFIMIPLLCARANVLLALEIETGKN